MLLAAVSSQNFPFCGRARLGRLAHRFSVREMRPAIAAIHKWPITLQAIQVIRGMFALSVVYLTTDAMTSTWNPAALSRFSVHRTRRSGITDQAR
jgi:hypothetical protein